MSFWGMLGGVGSNAYNDQTTWGDDEPDDGDLSQAFDALESAGVDGLEAADYLDELVMSGGAVRDLIDITDGVVDHVDNGDVPEIGDDPADDSDFYAKHMLGDEY